MQLDKLAREHQGLPIPASTGLKPQIHTTLSAFYLVYVGTRIGTQVFGLVQQALPHLSHYPSSYLFLILSHMTLIFSLSSLWAAS